MQSQIQVEMERFMADMRFENAKMAKEFKDMKQLLHKLIGKTITEDQEKGEWITLQELAKRKRVTTQTIMNRFRNGLYPYESYKKEGKSIYFYEKLN